VNFHKLIKNWKCCEPKWWSCWSVNCKAQPQSFVADQQVVHLNECKCELQVGVVVMLCDFSENCSFILQDEQREWHVNELSYTSLIIISDCCSPLSEIFILFLRSAAWYKNNKDFLNLTLQEEDFVVPVEWDLFGTLRGKSVWHHRWTAQRDWQ
jgi:hypothetical protein